MAKFANILETVGRTPVVRINRIAPKNINLFVKIDGSIRFTVSSSRREWK